MIRNRLVVATPEEKVRQQLLYQMIFGLGYPKGLISVEKKIGNRRFDLVCYARLSILPLLLIECKAGEINKVAENQVLGYNATVKAPFICLACATTIKTFWQEQGKIVSVPFLPTYAELYAFSKRS